MTERPILFSAPMVRALLAGTKTQTRRIVKPQFAPDALPVEMPASDPIGGWVVSGHSGIWWCEAAANPDDARRCPYGKPGDRLWVRETTQRRPALNILTGEPLDPKYDGGAYSADDEPLLTPNGFDFVWWYSRKVCPAIHMPRWASRITLEVTDVRVERLQDISEEDARTEGVEPLDGTDGRRWRHYFHDGYACAYQLAGSSYATLWESINGPRSWAANPWVWVVAFRRVT